MKSVCSTALLAEPSLVLTLSSCSWGQVPTTRCCSHSLLPATPSYGGDICHRLCAPVPCGTSHSICSLLRGHLPRHLASAVGAARWRILWRRKKSARPPGRRWFAFPVASGSLLTSSVLQGCLGAPLLASLFLIKAGVAARGRPPQAIRLVPHCAGTAHPLLAAPAVTRWCPVRPKQTPARVPGLGQATSVFVFLSPSCPVFRGQPGCFLPGRPDSRASWDVQIYQNRPHRNVFTRLSLPSPLPPATRH